MLTVRFYMMRPRVPLDTPFFLNFGLNSKSTLISRDPHLFQSYTSTGIPIIISSMDSVRQVSQDLDSLAQAIVAKNKEIDNLKTELNRQINIVNRYIELLVGDQLQNSDIDVAGLEKIVNDHPCPKCNNEDVIVVPRHKIKLVETRLITEESQSVDQAPHRPKYTPPKTQGSGKKTCSYCHAPGHKRAMCPERLATPKDLHS